MIEVRAVAGPTGRLLAQELRAAGVEVGTRNPQGIVSYGVSVQTNLPVLNGAAGRLDKYAQFERLRGAAVSVPRFNRTVEGLTFPVLGRSSRHARGRDILPFLANDREFRQLRNRADYFVQYVPTDTEYRVWAYRRRTLGVYEKVLRYEGRRRNVVGASWHNGYAFEYRRETPEALRALGANAVNALGLDFGAVDILRGMDGNYYVLEVNTAPGVEGPGRQAFTSLVEHIASWSRNGFRRRNGDNEQPNQNRRRA